MVEILLALLLYALLLDCALKKASVNVGLLPSTVRRRTLAGLLPLRPRAPAVLRRASPTMPPGAARGDGGVPGGRR